jgi:hypothetical protein
MNKAERLQLLEAALKAAALEAALKAAALDPDADRAKVRAALEAYAKGHAAKRDNKPEMKGDV